MAGRLRIIKLIPIAILLSLLLTAKVHAETIQYRIDNNLSELKYSLELTDFAYSRQQELCSGEWSHDGFFNRHGTLSDNYKYVGENLGTGYGGDDNLVFDAWLNSPTHYDNIVKPIWTHIGKAKFNCNNETYWVEIFGQVKENSKVQEIIPITLDLTKIQEPTPTVQENLIVQTPEPTVLNNQIVHTIKPCSIYDQVMKPYTPQPKSLWQKLKEYLILLVN